MTCKHMNFEANVGVDAGWGRLLMDIPFHLRLASTGENRWRLTPIAFAVVLLLAGDA